ncbi:MAG TPA: hypothetical protein VIS99_02520, partial [Terrimicrobiaceae bacterium]
LSGFAILRDLRIEDFQRDMVWKNLFLAMFVTQRALLFAIPAGLILLHAWRQQYFRGSQRIPPLWLQLLLYASMPLFSIHTFLFLSLVLLAIFASSLFSVRTPMGGVRRTKDATDLLTFVALAVVPATMAVLLVTGFFSASAEIRWAPDWIIGGPDGHFATWFWDFGVTIPLCLMLVFILFFDKDRESRCFVWMASSLFGLCCLFSFAPWEWDNMKLMLWSWLVIAPYLWGKVLAPLVLPARVALCVLLLFSGGVSLIGGLDASQGYVIAHRSELAAWQKATSGIPANVRFATVPDYNHPLLLLGRKVASGYEWHLWSHGLDFRRDFELLRAALSGQVSWRVSAPRLGVEWLALRKKDLPQTKPPGEPPPPEAFGALYDLRPLFKPGPASQEPPQLPPQSVDLSW